MGIVSAITLITYVKHHQSFLTHNWKCWPRCVCFCRPLASSMFAPGVPEVMKEFHSTNIKLASFVVSVYVLGFAAGPM
jgi:MFS family permease